MIGAHLDSWHSAPGATDNADGSAIVLEAMRILAAVGARPQPDDPRRALGRRRTGPARIAGVRPAAPRRRRERGRAGALLGLLQHGSRNRTDLRMVPAGPGRTRGRSWTRWLEPFKDLGARKNVPQNIGNTDHLSFTAIGLPGFNPIQDYVDYDVRTHHTNVDTFERVREADLKQAAIILASFAYHAAMRNEKMPRPAAQ